MVEDSRTKCAQSLCTYRHRHRIEFDSSFCCICTVWVYAKVRRRFVSFSRAILRSSLRPNSIHDHMFLLHCWAAYWLPNDAIARTQYHNRSKSHGHVTPYPLQYSLESILLSPIDRIVCAYRHQLYTLDVDSTQYTYGNEKILGQCLSV